MSDLHRSLIYQALLRWREPLTETEIWGRLEEEEGDDLQEALRLSPTQLIQTLRSLQGERLVRAHPGEHGHRGVCPTAWSAIPQVTADDPRRALKGAK